MAVVRTTTNFGVSVLPADGFVGFMPVVESKTKTNYVPVVPVQVRTNLKCTYFQVFGVNFVLPQKYYVKIQPFSGDNRDLNSSISR